MRAIEAFGIFILAWPLLTLFIAVFLIDSEKLEKAKPEDRESGLQGLLIVSFFIALGLALITLAR